MIVFIVASRGFPAKRS